jgi:hypothetical protein
MTQANAGGRIVDRNNGRGKGCYRVLDRTGQVIYQSNMIEYAIRAAEEGSAVPYIESKRGRRPVVDGQVGRYGEDLDSLRERIYGSAVAR